MIGQTTSSKYVPLTLEQAEEKYTQAKAVYESIKAKYNPTPECKTIPPVHIKTLNDHLITLELMCMQQELKYELEKAVNLNVDLYEQFSRELDKIKDRLRNDPTTVAEMKTHATSSIDDYVSRTTHQRKVITGTLFWRADVLKEEIERYLAGFENTLYKLVGDKVVFVGDDE